MTEEVFNNVFQDKLDEGKVYTLVNKEDDKKFNLPADPNFQNFYDKQLTSEYLKHIYLNKAGDRLSDLVYHRLLVFYFYIILTCTCYLIFAVIAYSQNSVSTNQMIFHLFGNLLIIATSIGLTVLFRFPKFLIAKFQLIFTSLGLLYITYMVLGNQFFLGYVFKVKSAEFGLPLTASIIGMTSTLRYLLCHSFLSSLIIHTTALLEYVIVLIITEIKRNEDICLFFILFIYSVLQTIDTRHAESIQKKDFWLQYKYEKSFRTSMNNKIEEQDSPQTETEILIESCDSIKRTIKHCISVIIFKDIKDSLKLAQIKLEQIKQIISRGVYLSDIKLEQNHKLDPEDKKFITQNFINAAMLNSRSLPSDLTLFDPREIQIFPCSDYGVEKLESMLSQYGKNWNFDIWFIHNTTGQSIAIIGKYLFGKWQFNEYLSQSPEVTDSFFRKIEAGYNKNPYHNACHAADVLHTQLFFITQSNLVRNLTQLDIICCIIAALGHDIGHPALTNRFLVNNCDEIAITYNDISVLENMHSSKTFEILKKQETKILDNLPGEDWAKSRKMIIEMILETDMSKHFEILGKFKTRAVTLNNIEISFFEDKCQALGMSLKCSDIGHSAKESFLHEKWSMLVCEEFFQQGDLEKDRGQAVSMYCDRENTDIPKSQAGFIRNICLPLFETWCFYLKSETVEKTALSQLRNNLEFWVQKKKRRSTVMPFDPREDDVFKRIQTSF